VSWLTASGPTSRFHGGAQRIHWRARSEVEVDVSRKEIAERIAKLTDEERHELYRLCETRRRKNGDRVEVAVYEAISADIAEDLHRQGLVWLVGSMLAAARHDVYAYWLKHIQSPALQQAD
jgi:hypothetical protein